jgi:hypothetical protein
MWLTFNVCRDGKTQSIVWWLLYDIDSITDDVLNVTSPIPRISTQLYRFLGSISLLAQ